MTVERNLLISVLKLTKTGPIQLKLVSRDAHIPIQVADEVLRKFSDARLVKYVDELIEASPNQRARMAIHAVKLGTDFERVCNVLEWKEFENITATAFEADNYMVKRRFRFKWAGRRWEIDVLGCKEPLVACVDCKQWHRNWRRSAIIKTVELQVERTRALAEALVSLRESVGLVNWKEAILVPIVLSLVPSPFKFYDKVPIVPVLQLPDFLNEILAHINSLTHFSLKFE
jgi:Holliday junction resolvase-like predicted endonuclease